MEQTSLDETRPVDVMRERILPTAATAALFITLANLQLGPLAAPQKSTPPEGSAAKKTSMPTKQVAQAPAKPVTGTIARSALKRAKYEPVRGAYLGAALDYTGLSGEGSQVGPMADIMGDWENESWRENAIYVQFTPFPHEDGAFPSWDSDPKGWASIADFCNAAAALDAAPMLTLEPKKPRVFVDGWKEGASAYDATRALAISLGRWNKPAFVRFGHEMNGSWYPWSEWSDLNKNMRRDPGEETGFYAADYRKAYRNVALLLRKHAPNVALVWCPNSGLLGGDRRDVFAPFYPGDDVVDWVALDIYERGWTMPVPGSKLWGGQLAYNLTRDMADDPSTLDKNESVNFYETYAVKKNKPMMLAETGATLSFRSDLEEEERALLNHQWKAGAWNESEYGWLQATYGTSAFQDHKLLQPIDRAFPLLKAIVWFQIGKREYIPVQKPMMNKRNEIVWFDDAWADYRMGGGAQEGAPPPPYAETELDLFRRLTNNKYFLSKIVK